jgi:hypothetical protein
MHSETHFSEEVKKNVEQFMVTKPSINDNLLDMAPGGDLLLGLAVSADLKAFKNLLEKLPMDSIPDIGGKIQEATGIAAEDIWSALNGDFVLAINGLEEGGMMPVEVLVGIGVKGDELQKQMMEKMGEWTQVEEQEDFFMINVNGMELYSGIIDNVWIITNARGYKDAIKGSGLDASLKDSKFMDYAGGGMGMYMNLDLSTYPATLQGMIGQDPEAASQLELITGSLSSIGIEASNYENDLTLITAKEDENSLYTLLKLVEGLD